MARKDGLLKSIIRQHPLFIYRGVIIKIRLYLYITRPWAPLSGRIGWAPLSGRIGRDQKQYIHIRLVLARKDGLLKSITRQHRHFIYFWRLFSHAVIHAGCGGMAVGLCVRIVRRMISSYSYVCEYLPVHSDVRTVRCSLDKLSKLDVYTHTMVSRKIALRFQTCTGLVFCIHGEPFEVEYL